VETLRSGSEVGNRKFVGLRHRPLPKAVCLYTKRGGVGFFGRVSTRLASQYLLW
jgi:hypothetical protein